MMDEEIVSLLTRILEELQEVNQNLSVITSNGVYDLSDVCGKLDDINTEVANGFMQVLTELI